MKASLTGLLWMAGAVVSACSPSSHDAEKPAPPPPVTVAHAAIPEAPAPRPPRAQLDGRAFPDKVLALTWDDGPDADTLALAQYLHALGVSATFFVVAEWIDGVSDEPGQGRGVFQTGHEHLPILGDLVALGHRVGNHTLNHVLLDSVPPEKVVAQLRENQDRIDPFVAGGLPLFRAPGGAWSAAASAAVDGDPELERLVGPVRWDVDRKDWDGSLHCRSSRPAVECERAAPGGGSRVKPSVMAERYLASIEEAGRGIVLLHDRVGHVGSGYGCAIAEVLVPRLIARGYVFAAPVLRFGPLVPLRGAAPDVDGADGAQVGDVDGDGRLDRCTRGKEGVVCALATGSGLGEARRWSRPGDFAEGAIRLGDVNGDGRADVCGRSREGVTCALSDGGRFLAATVWSAETSDTAGRPFRLADVNGDGRADFCVRAAEGEACAMAP